MLNDDLIVPKSGSDCPEPDEIGCTEIQAKNNDALIYPTSKLSTAKPSLSTRYKRSSTATRLRRKGDEKKGDETIRNERRGDETREDEKRRQERTRE